MNGLTQSVAVARRGRLLRLGALISAALMLSLSAFSTPARAAESNPTIVLVHGAFASPDGWDGVADALHKDGSQTATPALSMTSVSDDVAIVRSTLDSIPGDKILVVLRRVRDHQRRQRPNRRSRTGLHGGLRPGQR
jgi:pimeloyl-ACP methyl ester carboxylesterase